jgi:3-oxoacyl-[acyl-carrier protein] reductase
MSDGDFARRVALVTGASGGIGAELSLRLAAAGAAIGVHYATNREAAERVVSTIAANAGLSRPASYEEVDAAVFDETVAVNLRAPYLLARCVLPGMRARGYGRILFTSLVAALTGGIVGPHYASSKAGLHGLTHFLASRVAPDGVTANAIAPALRNGYVTNQVIGIDGGIHPR